MKSFDFTPTRRKARPESVVPLINVIFILLIFFLMSAQITPPQPLDLTPAQSETAQNSDSQERTLWRDSDGTLTFGDAHSDAVWDAIAASSGPLTLQADATTPALDIAELLMRLGAMGLTNVTLVTRSPAK